MTRYIIRRTLSLIPTIIGVTIVVFLFVHLIPGDPAEVFMGEHGTDESIARIREQWGLDRPLWEQYLRYMGRVLRFDLGTSVHERVPVMTQLIQRFPGTVELSFFAMFFAIIIGVPAGVISAARRNSVFDFVSMIGALIGVSMPIFWLGIMLLFVFGAELQWLPTGGRLPSVMESELRRITGLHVLDSLLTLNFPALVTSIKHLLLPSIALGTIPMSIIARMTRSSMLEILQQDYIRTATAKGLRERVVIVRHALKNAFLPVITIIGLQTGSLLAGAIMTETVFSWLGIGKWVFDAIQGRDYAVIQSAVLVITIVIAIVNLVVDVSYAYFDPRIRYE